MKTVTFYSNTRYAGGRSHRNITTLEFVEDKDIFEASEYYGYNLYPSAGEDFENGVKDSSGNEVMDAQDFKNYHETGIGSIDLGETTFSSVELKDISADEFKSLPTNLQVEYINIWNDEVTEGILEFAKKDNSLDDIFSFGENDWKYILEEMNEDSISE